MKEAEKFEKVKVERLKSYDKRTEKAEYVENLRTKEWKSENVWEIEEAEKKLKGWNDKKKNE